MSKYGSKNDPLTNIKVIFHVHLPDDIEKAGNPVVLGDGEKLGSWKNPVVKLHQPFPQNPTYWQSDIVTILLSNFNEINDIQYKYAIHISKYTLRGRDEKIAFEGNGDRDNRTLDIERNDQFGIWKNNYALPDRYRLLSNNIYDYAFVDHIYNSIKANNLKDKVIEYQHLLTLHNDLTIRASNLRFIANRIDDKLREKRLFLCLLLGYYIPRQGAFYELPSQFPSELLLSILGDYRQEILPSDTKDHMYTSIMTLVQHNALRMKFEWLVIFTSAAEIDPNYTFIDRLRYLKYSNDDLLARFTKRVEIIMPYLVGIEFEAYVKIVKWLIQLCQNMDSLFIVWNNVIIHNNKVDKSISRCLIERARENISHGDAVTLEYHFKRLPKDYRDELSEVFRDYALFLLESPCRIWTKENVTAIKKLLYDNSLEWCREEFIESLESISRSNTLELLNIFPELLDDWFQSDFSDTREKKIPKICITWFENLLIKLYTSIVASNSNESNFVFLVFIQLERMYPLLGQRINIWRDLTEIAIERVKGCSEAQIFAATKLIVKLKQDDVKVLFSDTVKGILNKTAQQTNDQLLYKILIICDCHDRILDIPNPMSEDILCHIMSRLQSKPAAFSPSEHHLNILKSSNFWSIILRATGSVADFNSNPFVKRIRASISELAGLLLEKSIDIQLLQQLLEYSDEKLFQHFDAVVQKRKALGDIIVSQDEIAKLRKLCSNYQIQLDILFKFYTRFCSAPQIADVDGYIFDVIQHMQNLDKVKLEQVLMSDYWAFHEKTLDSAKRCYKFERSQTFRNIFEDCLQKDPAATKLEYIARKLIPIVFERYNAMCEQFKEWEKLKCSDASWFWKNVTNVDVELDLMEESNIYESKRFVQTLDHLSKIPNWIEKLEHLEKVVEIEIFKVAHSENDWLSKSIRILKDGSMELGQINNFFDYFDGNLSKVNQDCWKLVKELSIADEFIGFLGKIDEHDIQNLINDVDDDHSDKRLIQEEEISLLIQVKRFLFPLVNMKTETIADFLDALLLVIKNHHNLGEKVELCNKTLRDLYSACGETAKEIIKNAALNGTFTFARDEKEDKCLVYLKYPSKFNVKYDLNGILDLRGRALLIAKLKNTVNDKDTELSKNFMNEFVVQVDIAQEIINIVFMLMQIGHIGYRKFVKELQGTDDMKDYRKFLKDEHEKWKAIVDHAHQRCYYLTFFSAKHILLFYDYFTSEKLDKENEEKCKTLIRFINSKAQLPSHKNVQGILRESKDYLEILCEIGNELERIFRNISKQSRKFKVTGRSVRSDIITKGKLFVASCSDKTQVPNIIMSLYAVHGYYPELWQLLICTTSTTIEELMIFIKRSFFASNNGYENHLFCIANLELLGFELQYNLVNYIKTMQLEYVNENYLLALLCCQESGMSNYVLDQYSLEVQEIDDLDNETMQEIYQILCPNVICISSDLSGQGKTEWIKEASFSKQKIPYSFLISGSMDLSYLVNKLKGCNLKHVQSLHINILSADYHEDVHIFLFELLTFKIISCNEIIVSIPETFIFIEIASSVEQNLLNHLPMLRFLYHKHLPWNFKNFRVSQEITSPIQVVCHFLKLHDLGKIDTVEIFFQTSKSDPLSEEFCQYLIMKYFLNKSDKNISSYRYIEIFINVLADQLIRFSLSQYFTISNLKLKLKETNVRSTIIDSLIDISKDFAINSNNNILFFNSQPSNSFSVLYNDKNKVPDSIKLLLKSQAISNPESWELDDFNTMSATELLMKLETMARRSKEKLNHPEYTLSIDNLIKMALILLRVRANTPVVICGEAGCGKTSLIAYLAMIVEVQFHVLNLHAGINEKTIIMFMSDASKKAEKGEIWLFFDEINTCNHLGLLADLISNRTYQDKPVHPNICFFSACNPYRLRQTETGLTTKINNYKGRSNLVYQVKPLPDQILDYVWDYGNLTPEVECKHIQIMIEKELKTLAHPVFAELLFASQKFIRNVEGPYGVSLRDIKRTITLVQFFYNSLENRSDYEKEHEHPPPESPTTVTRSYILALSLCYHSRLYEQDLRKQYRQEMEQILQNHKDFMGEHMFAKIIREEQEFYFNRMHFSPNIAKNEALLENVLVMIICILTRIPLFLIGASGSSKSLAIQLISSNLRGSDSTDKYFKILPRVNLISHQGSLTSTSDGIKKVFDKASAQETSSEQFSVISVVLIDNVELAEMSPFDPLKILHSLLEPSYPATGPTVSVIGISNWRPDIGKSSRALLVHRPRFDLDDLVDTAECLLNTKVIVAGALEALTKAYLDYEKHSQVLPDFHGLRDYYALIERLSLNEMTSENIQLALARNFGGTENNAELFEKYFGNVLRIFNNNNPWIFRPIPIERLIDSNLGDADARHLMVIGKRDSIVGLLAYQLRTRNLDPIVILGSRFPDDQYDYSYSILNRIKMCIQAGKTLILADLEIVYGNLYDLWNRNYTGTFADLMLYASPTFKFFLVMDEMNLPSADPSLLNRFEKQTMSINDILNERQKLLVENLGDWARRMSTLLESGSVKYLHRFTQKDLFIGFDSETLQSLVINITKNNPEAEDSGILDKCKEYLIAIVPSDGVVRAEKSALERDEIDQLRRVYSHQYHDCLYDYFCALFNQEKSLSDQKGQLIIVNTFSKINTDIKACLQDLLRYQVYNLSSFRTETQLSNLVKKFFFESTDQVLILQCDITAINAKCINLVKYIIEQFRNEFLAKREQFETNMPMKYACIILHIQRDYESNLISSNFICGWKRITIESLESPEIPLINFLDKSLYDIINSEIFDRIVNSTMPFEKILKDELLWCLSCIEYQHSNESYKNHISMLSENILNNSNFVQCLKTKAFGWILKNCKNWQYEVALSKKNLSKFTCFSLALQNYVKIVIKQTIAKILYSHEKISAIATFFSNENIEESEAKKELSDIWKEFFMDDTMINIEELCDPEPSIYIMPCSIINDLEFPFSYYFMNQINYYKNYYYEELDILKQDSENVNHELYEEDHIEDFKHNLISIHPNFGILEKFSELYYNDFIKITLSTLTIRELVGKKELDFVLRYLIGDKIVNDPFILHIYWWKYANEILIQLKLIENFPSIIKKAQNDFVVYGKLDQYLFRESINLILQNICDDKPWKQYMENILAVNDKINDSSSFSNLQLLFICNDLLKINTFPLEKIKEVVYLRKSAKKQEFITAEIINLIFIGLDNNNDMVSIKSFITRILKLISLESEARLILYKNLFSRNPFKLVDIIIDKIFTTEVRQNKRIFFTLIKNSEEALKFSIRLKAINDNIRSVDSNMAELCCEVIQNIFNGFELNELLPYFKDSIELFVKPSEQQISVLQQITSIALLKEFIYRFWKSYFQEDNTLSKSLIKEIDDIMKINDHSFIQSIRSYFLYQQSSFNNIKQLETLKEEFPWLRSSTEVEINYLPKLLKPTRKVNFEDFQTFYNSNLQNLDKYPFLSVFFKHCERLKLIKYLYPIIRFVKILSPKLEYHLTRKAAQIMTFHEFIKKESADEEEYANLKSLFEEFAVGWNSVINYISQYQSKELPLNKPFMNLELPVIFGLIDQKDAGIYLYAILDFLIKLHNEFLDNVKAISVGKCESLKFLEDVSWNDLTPKTYFITSKNLIQAQDINFIKYEWNDKILKYSQRNQEIEGDINFIFDLQKIENKLAKKLVLNKVYFEMEDGQFYLKNFIFKYELFHNFPRILFDIKKILPQEPIPADKMLIILSIFQPSNSSLILNNSLNSINLSELLFHFEIILCFVKELSIKNGSIFILDFVDQWLKLARYNITFIDVFKEFSLKHIIAFYELIEEQVANTIIHNVDDKFKIPLTQQMKDSIDNSVEYYDLENPNQRLISAKAFALALKRFIYRFLLIDSNMENLNLNTYFLDFTLDLWTGDIKEELIEKLFPANLLVSHAYNSYIFIVDEIEKAINEKQKNKNITSASSLTTRKTLTRIKKFKKFTD